MTGFEKVRKILSDIAAWLIILELFIIICTFGIWIFVFGPLLLALLLPFFVIAVLYFVNGSPKYAQYRKTLMIPILVTNIIIFIEGPTLLFGMINGFNVVMFLYCATAAAESIFEIVDATRKRIAAPKEVLKSNPVTRETWAIRIASIVALCAVVAFGIFATFNKKDFAELDYFMYVLILTGMTIVIFGFSRKIHYAGYLVCLVAFSSAFAIFYINQYKATGNSSWIELRSTANIISVLSLAVTALGLITTISVCGILQLKKQLAANKAATVVEPQC